MVLLDEDVELGFDLIYFGVVFDAEDSLIPLVLEEVLELFEGCGGEEALTQE